MPWQAATVSLAIRISTRFGVGTVACIIEGKTAGWMLTFTWSSVGCRGENKTTPQNLVSARVVTCVCNARVSVVGKIMADASSLASLHCSCMSPTASDSSRICSTTDAPSCQRRASEARKRGGDAH